MDLIIVTESAKKQIRNILKNEAEGNEGNEGNGGNQNQNQNQNYVRIEVLGGGCSSFKYEFSITKKKEKNDWCLQEKGARLLIDQDSLDLIKGSTLDYQIDLIGAAFKIINPNIASSCGCGMSFSI